MSINEKLSELVNALPEFYQPIYAHSEWDDKPLRNCKDRLPVIEKIYDDLSGELKRPLRVLDLGCAQGFFSLSLAKRGAIVTGLDISEQNIRLCKFLASEHLGIKTDFVCGRIEEFLSTVKVGEYDLVLCLSVLHNISKYLGVKKIQDMMTDLSRKVAVGIFEFALERVHAAYIPADYRDFLPGFSFIKELSASDHRNGSGVKRPICFASDKYTWFENFGVLKTDKISYNVHPYLAKTDLIHFHCGNKFIKFFYIKAQGQLRKAQQEIQFLKDFGGKRGLPKLLATYIEQDQNGIRAFIIRDRLDGVTLSEKISGGEKIDRWDVLKQALEWMVFFEQRGYYHGDIQTSNFIYGTDGKLYPIDYEEIRREPIVLIWPYKVNLLFLIFMNAVLDLHRPERATFHRKVYLLTKLKKHLTQKQFEQISAIEESEKFFARLYEILFGSESSESKKAVYNLRDSELLAQGKFLDDVSNCLKELQTALAQTNDNTAKFDKYMNNIAQIFTAQQQRLDRLEKIVREMTHDRT